MWVSGIRNKAIGIYAFYILICLCVCVWVSGIRNKAIDCYAFYILICLCVCVCVCVWVWVSGIRNKAIDIYAFYILISLCVCVSVWVCVCMCIILICRVSIKVYNTYKTWILPPLLYSVATNKIGILKKIFKICLSNKCFVKVKNTYIIFMSYIN